MTYDTRSALSEYVGGLPAKGRFVFTAEEAEHAVGINHGAFLDAAERLQRRDVLLNPKRGFYVVVPQEFMAWKAPPPEWYIHDLMCHVGVPYYVGLLKAASYHGASHQAVMEFQVVTNKPMQRILAGRSRIVFYYRKYIDAVIDGINDRKTDTGMIKISSPALTALDLFRYPRGCGGVNHIATVLQDLGQKINGKQLAQLSRHVETPIIQKLGYVLDFLGYGAVTAGMAKVLHARGSLPWTELNPRTTRWDKFASQKHNTKRDKLWHVIVRSEPDPDE